MFYSIRSERLLIEQLDYNLLFRWFVGLSVDEPVWDHSTFSKNRDRLLESEVADAFFRQVLDQAQTKGLTSDEHFSVDGTLIEAWASMKSFRPKDDDEDGDKGAGATPSAIFMGRRAATTPTPPPPTHRRGCTRRARARSPSSAISAPP